MALAELLVSAALLLLLTAVALGSLMPVLRRQEKFATVDDRVRGFMTAREALHGRLARARVRSVERTHMTVIFPRKIPTNYGPLSKLAPGKTVEYDVDTEYDVWFDVDRLMFDEQVLWRLGAGSSMWLEPFGADEAFVRFNFEGREEPTRTDSPKWTRSFVLFLPNQER